MSRTITIEVSDELLELLGVEDKIEEEAKRSLVLGLVRKGKISRGKAAEFLGISVWDLPGLLSSYEIPWFDYSREQIEEDIASMCSLGKKAGM